MVWMKSENSSGFPWATSGEVAGKFLHIPVLDHVTMTSESFLSFAEEVKASPKTVAVKNKV